MFIILFVVSAASGVLGGLGLGAGTLLIPLLTAFFGVTQQQAQAYNLIAFIPMAAVSLFVHSKNGLIKKRGLLPVILAAAAAAIAAGTIALGLDGSVLKRLFGGFLIATSVATSVARFRQKKQRT
ncbi:MAG: TSUP family transporter [Clostridia bacterium]|nr:TSUP family transporter [Clostridia bacterium]